MKIIRLIADTFKKILKVTRKKEFWVSFYLIIRYGRAKRYKPVFNKKIYGLKLNIPDVPSFVYQFKEIFFEEIYDFKTLKKNPVIIDCGANIGTSILYFKKLYPEANVIGYEADEYIFNFLKQNLELNRVNDVEIFNKAVWINNEGVNFSADGADGGHIKDGGNKIDSIRLRDVLSTHQEVEMLKIDIEGAELEVLEDCQEALGNVKNLFVEYHSFNSEKQHLSRLLNIVENNGFRYFIETVTRNQSPFLGNNRDQEMDLQLNIYCLKQ